ncbi:MAG: hypothetical protein K0Q78_2032, partial [Cellvibrio sp.]|nr:hypothetical protein [Cellvibrio sp.]
PVLMVVLGILAAISLPAYQSYLDAAQSADSSYTAPDSDTFPSEYTEDGAIEDTRFSDDAIEDGISYETPEEEAVDDEVVEDDVVEDEGIDAAETELMEEAGSPETE